jgi:hypothetical protein
MTGSLRAEGLLATNLGQAGFKYDSPDFLPSRKKWVWAVIEPISPFNGKQAAEKQSVDS